MKNIIAATLLAPLVLLALLTAFAQPAAAAGPVWVNITVCEKTATGAALCTLTDRGGEEVEKISIASDPANVPMGWSIIARRPGWTWLPIPTYKPGIIKVTCNTRTAKCKGQLTFD
jgi:hypothetical protein